MIKEIKQVDFNDKICSVNYLKLSLEEIESYNVSCEEFYKNHFSDEMRIEPTE